MQKLRIVWEKSRNFVHRGHNSIVVDGCELVLMHDCKLHLFRKAAEYLSTYLLSSLLPGLYRYGRRYLLLLLLDLPLASLLDRRNRGLNLLLNLLVEQRVRCLLLAHWTVLIKLLVLLLAHEILLWHQHWFLGLIKGISVLESTHWLLLELLIWKIHLFRLSLSKILSRRLSSLFLRFLLEHITLGLTLKTHGSHLSEQTTGWLLSILRLWLIAKWLLHWLS